MADVVGGGTPPTTESRNFDGGRIPWITPADLSGYLAKYISHGARNITPEGLANSAARLLPTGTVLFSSRAPIGYVAIAANPVATNQGFKSFILPTGIGSEYVYYYLQRARELAVGLASGTTFLEISGRQTAKLPLPIAPQREQERIVEAIESSLTRLDDAVATLERVQRNLKRYRTSVLKAAVEGRLVPTEADLARVEGRDYEPASVLLDRILAERRRRWEVAELAKMKAKGKVQRHDGWKAKYKVPVAPEASELSDLPEGWCWASVEQLGFIASGQTPKGVISAGSSQGHVPWFRVGDMNTEGNELHMRVAKEWLTNDQVAALGLHVRPAGTILFPKRGGAIATNKKRRLARPGAYDLNTMGIVPVGSIGPFLWTWFQGLELGSLADGSNVPQINHGDIGRLPVPLAPEQEQRRIVSEVSVLLSVADAAISAVSSSRLLVHRLRQSILKSAFDGKLVDQDPSDEPASKLLERIRAARSVSTGTRGLSATPAE